jgi:hypothetical protein
MLSTVLYRCSQAETISRRLWQSSNASILARMLTLNLELLILRF